MPSLSEFPSQLCNVDAVIANGQQASSSVDLSGCSVVGFTLPAAFTGTQVSFQVASTDGGTFQDLYDKNNAKITLTVAQGRTYALGDLTMALCGFRFLKIVSGSAEGAQRAVTLFCRPV